MLARASSDAGTRLRRSKSASTVHRHPPPISEPLDSYTSQQQALAAATAAFARSQGQAAADRKSKRSFDVSRSKSNASRKSLSSQGSHFPPRESSFQSSQLQHSGHLSSTGRESRAATMNTEQFPPFYPTPSSDRPQSSYRPLSSQASVTLGEKVRPRSQSKAHQQSVPSSVTSQQIRKARSMYYASSIQTGSPIARPPAKYLTTPPVNSIAPRDPIPALPSMRALGPSPLVGPRMPVTVAHDETVDSARDKYLQNFQHKTVKHKPSMFLAPFKKRQDKDKDKTRRVTSGMASISTSSQKTPDEYTPDTAFNDFNPTTEPKEKRSFSGSLKSRFKRVFRRTSNRSPNLPVQQIEASRDYFNPSHLQAPGIDDTIDIPSPAEVMIQRVRSRTPSYEALRPAFFRPGSRNSSDGSSGSNRSNRSLHSESTTTHMSASRVTSWGTTSTTDNLTQRAIKRLTVIHEAKDSIGSEAERATSLVPRRKSLPLPALASFRDPMPMDRLAEEAPPTVDPKRVFSALMREIDASSSPKHATGSSYRTPGAESDVFESSATKELHNIARELHSSASRDFRPSMSSDHQPSSRRPGSAAAQSVQSKTSTIRSLGRAIRSTIRTVTPADQHSFMYPDHTDSGRAALPKLKDDTPASEDVVYRGEVPTDRKATILNHDCADLEFSTRACVPSASQIEQRVEKAKGRWKTPLEDIDTVSFPPETDRTYNVASFKLQSESHFAASKMAAHCARSSTSKHESDQNTPKPQAVMSPLSPSVYSRDTDGISILPNDSVISFDVPDSLERSHNGGSAVILTSQSVRSYVIGTPSPRRPDSTRTSRDWKAWLSHEISNMESSSQEDLTIHEHFTTPTGRNQCETTRTSTPGPDGDTTVILLQSCDVSTTKPDSELRMGDSVPEVSPSTNHHDNSEHLTSICKGGSFVLEKTNSHSGTFKEEVSPGLSHANIVHTQSDGSCTRPSPSPLLSRPRILSTPSHRSGSSQPSTETPRLSLMNERFPIIETGRSSSSNSARSSRLSKSPSESVASLGSDKSCKATLSPRVYSDLSDPTAGTNRNSQRLSNVALKRSDALHKRKENVTPPVLQPNMKHSVSPLALNSRAKSLQPLSSTAIDQNVSTHGQYMSNIPENKHSKHASSPSASPSRPHIHATLRPVSTHAHYRRPRSAFDLRSPRKYGKTNMPITTSPPSRPTLELQRSGLQIETSNFLRTDTTSINERIIDKAPPELERSGSITPGQRMADHFLKQRKSTSALESGKMRGGMKLVREDTPAFL